MPIDLDFTDVPRPSFDPVPEDDYDLLLEDIQIKPGKDGTKPTQMAHCVFTVQGGDYDGRKIWHYQNLTGEGLKYAKVMLESLYGFPLETGFTLDEDELVGKTCTAHVTVKPREDDPQRMQNRISYFKLPFSVE